MARGSSGGRFVLRRMGVEDVDAVDRLSRASFEHPWTRNMLERELENDFSTTILAVMPASETVETQQRRTGEEGEKGKALSGGGGAKPGVKAGEEPSVEGSPGVANSSGVETNPGVEGNPGVDRNPEAEGNPDIDGSPDVEGNPGVDRNPGVDKNSGVEGNSGIDGSPGVGRNSDVDGNPAVDRNSGVDRNSRVGMETGAGKSSDAEEIVGFIVYWTVLDDLHILNIAVHPRFRRRGIAQMLLARCESSALASGADHITLEVRRSNAPAIALYEQVGFRGVGVRVGYYEPDGEDALVMSKTLL